MSADEDYISKKALEDTINANCYVPTNGTVRKNWKPSEMGVRMMGSDDENNYMMMLDGQTLFDAFCDLAERELQPVYAAMDSCTTIRQRGPEPIEVEVKMPKRWRCNSRKRFVKLLMADGVSRNSANELAWLARCFYRSYWDAYLDHKLFGLKK